MDGDRRFAQRRMGDTPYWEAGSGDTVVAIAKEPTRAHVLLAEHRRVIVFPAVDRIDAALMALGIGQFDLLGERDGATVALWLALANPAAVGAIVLAGPADPPDEAFRDLSLPVLVLTGTRDGAEGGDRYRRLLPNCHFMLVYDTGPDIGAERPEALAYIAQEFFERRDLFLVSRESGMTLP